MAAWSFALHGAGWWLVWIIDLRGIGWGWNVVVRVIHSLLVSQNISSQMKLGHSQMKEPHKTPIPASNLDVWNSFWEILDFWKIEKKGLKQKVTVYQHAVRFRVHLFFSDLSEPQKPRSSFPGRNLCWCSRGITPWNCTCRTLDSWPLDGKETKPNVTGVTAPAPGGFQSFSFLCVFLLVT